MEGDMTALEFALYSFGFVSGFGFRLPKRSRPLPPPEDVAEETMQRFERFMEGSITMKSDKKRMTDTLH